MSSGDDTQALVGTVLEGKYRLQRELGAGGMGVVYLARHETIERKVAIKVLHNKLASDESVRRRFETEAKAIARLQHSNCVMLYEFGYSEEIEALFAVFEFVDGSSLESWVGKRLPLSDVLGLGIQVADGINHAHDNNIIHRDLKPENIMIASDGDGGKFKAKVLDFGIARIAEEDEKNTRLTQMGQMFGTPPYMSPEQVRAKLNVTYATDLYSIGVILYEMIEGELPFLGDTPIETVMMHLNDEVPPMRRKGVPEELASIVSRCLEKDAEQRFESSAALVDALEAVELSTTGPSALATANFSKLVGVAVDTDEGGVDAPSSPESESLEESREEDVANGPTLLAPESEEVQAPQDEVAAPQEISTQDVADDDVEFAMPTRKPIWVVAILLVFLLGGGAVLGVAIFSSVDESEEASEQATSDELDEAVAEDDEIDETDEADETDEEAELAAIEDEEGSNSAEKDEGEEDLAQEEEEGEAEQEQAQEDSDASQPSQPEPAPSQPAPSAPPPQEPETTPEPRQEEDEEPGQPGAPDAISLPGGGEEEDDVEDDDEESPQGPEGIGLPAPD